MTDLTASIDTLTGNPDGSALLTSHRMPLPATFSFDYFGMTFEVSIRRMAEGGAELVLQGRLGNIPYSAESVAAREFLLSLVDAGFPATDRPKHRSQAEYCCPRHDGFSGNPLTRHRRSRRGRNRHRYKAGL